MINLVMEKLEAVDNLKSYTKEILSLSPKTDDEKISIMIEERQKIIETINLINHNIDNYLKYNEDNYKETDEIKSLKSNIKGSIKEIIKMDNEIRKNINDELKDLKNKLNQPETTSKLVNIKI